MTCIYNYKDYLERRLDRQDVISAATVYGYYAMQMNVNFTKFIVLVLNHDDYSYYEYGVDHRRFFVSKHNDSLLHKIASVITPEMLQNRSMVRWWNCVFYELNGIRTYDNAYDELKISDDSDKTFKDVLEELMIIFSEIHLPLSNCHVFLTGDYADNPMMQFVLQKKYDSAQFVVLPSIDDSIPIDEEHIVSVPQKKMSKLVLHTNIPIDLTSIISESVNITLPLDTSKNNIMLSNIKWNDILVDDQKDYSVQEIDFKNIKLQVEYDSYHNIFMNCQDMRGNRKVIQIN